MAAIRARGHPAHALGKRQAGEQVRDVVLAQVHEREPERAGVRPSERAGGAAGVREHVGGHH